jgi:ribonuclease P protein component
MLPDKNRLKGALNFEKVKTRGEMYQSDNFGLLVREREDNNPSRFGIIVSTKISKKATDRNRIKRTLRKAIRLNLDKIKKGRDVVVLAKNGLLLLNAKEVEKEITDSFIKTNLV